MSFVLDMKVGSTYNYSKRIVLFLVTGFKSDGTGVLPFI